VVSLRQYIELQDVEVGTELKSGKNLLKSLYNLDATSGSALKAMSLSLYRRNRHPVPITLFNTQNVTETRLGTLY